MSRYTDAGKCIRIAQEIRQISNKQLCDEFGCHRQQLHRWRQSDNLKLHTIQKFASIFKMSLIDFISLDVDI